MEAPGLAVLAHTGRISATSIVAPAGIASAGFTSVVPASGWSCAWEPVNPAPAVNKKNAEIKAVCVLGLILFSILFIDTFFLSSGICP
jgi:hypothetical protein